MPYYDIHTTDGYARTGTLHTPHGDIQTPIFMPVGTRSAVKGITIDQIHDIGAQIMLVNNYHSYLRPGCDVVEKLGGLHTFMDVDIPILTDSGGFQVFSLGLGMDNKKTIDTQKSKEPLAKVTEEWVHFRSYLDGSKHFFTPENVMDMQCSLGADIIMAFDECAPGGSTHIYAQSAMQRTHRWAVRSRDRWLENEKKRAADGRLPQALFGIIQWVIYDDLRTQSCQYIADLDTPGIAIGGLSVWESKKDMYHILDVLAPILPHTKPRYLMWVGTPEDVVEGIYRGVDMFDCVLPTRIGRHGEAFSSYGNIKIWSEKYKYSTEHIPMLPEHETSISRRYSLGYLRHLVNVWEATWGVLLSLHNLEYLLNITKTARTAIEKGEYSAFREKFWSVYPGRKKGM